MKKMMICILFLLLGTVIVSAQGTPGESFDIEASLGPRIPIGVTKDDITTGLAIKLGAGYKITRFFELVHLAFDFGNSTPHNPNTVVVQDYYSYYGRLAMETVTVIGFPLTTRLHFPVKQHLFAYIGGGGAYYWFSSRLEDPLYGNLQEPRKRSGFGSVLEAGVYTNFFSENWLVTLTGNFVNLNTKGKSLSIREDTDPTEKKSRTDKYLTISFGVNYFFNR